jgi:hypothetical protein
MLEVEAVAEVLEDIEPQQDLPFLLVFLSRLLLAQVAQDQQANIQMAAITETTPYLAQLLPPVVDMVLRHGADIPLHTVTPAVLAVLVVGALNETVRLAAQLLHRVRAMLAVRLMLEVEVIQVAVVVAQEQ